MGILGWILFGLVVGIVAKFIMPGRDPGGIIITIILGIVGALLGGFIGQALNLYEPGEPAGFVGATLGAILILWIYRVATRKRSIAA
ncbi:MAG: GlsB/YeaQ/YmgE family stress response membrane protein [Acidobacteriota bacterium]